MRVMNCSVLALGVVLLLGPGVSAFFWTSGLREDTAEYVHIGLHNGSHRHKRSMGMPENLHFRLRVSGQPMDLRLRRSDRGTRGNNRRPRSSGSGPSVLTKTSKSDERLQRKNTQFPLFVIENGTVSRTPLPPPEEGVFYDVAMNLYQVIPDHHGFHWIRQQDTVKDFRGDYIYNTATVFQEKGNHLSVAGRDRGDNSARPQTRQKRHSKVFQLLGMSEKFILKHLHPSVINGTHRQATRDPDRRHVTGRNVKRHVTERRRKRRMTGRRTRRHVAPRKVRRVAVSHYEIELFMVADYKDYTEWLKYYDNNRTQTAREMHIYYSFIANWISQRYRSIGNMDPYLRIDIVTTGLLVVKSEADSYWTEQQVHVYPRTGRMYVEASGALEAFRRWVDVRPASLPQSDHWMLFTGHDIYTDRNPHIAGLAKLGGLCTYNSVSIIEQDNTASVGATAAHELGHSLSARHDGEEKGCQDEDNYIMSRKLKTPDVEKLASRPWQFSTCSVQAFRHFLSRKKCGLVEERGSNLLMTTELEGGQVFSADLQCQLALGKFSFFGRQLQQVDQYQSMCRRLFCAVPWDPTTFQAIFAMEKTTCGDRKWCVQGKCTADIDAPPALENCPQGDSPKIQCRRHYCRFYPVHYKDIFCCQTCSQAPPPSNFIYSPANAPVQLETVTRKVAVLPKFQPPPSSSTTTTTTAPPESASTATPSPMPTSTSASTSTPASTSTTSTSVPVSASTVTSITSLPLPSTPMSTSKSSSLSTSESTTTSTLAPASTQATDSTSGRPLTSSAAESISRTSASTGQSTASSTSTSRLTSARMSSSTSERGSNGTLTTSTSSIPSMTSSPSPSESSVSTSTLAPVSTSMSASRSTVSLKPDSASILTATETSPSPIPASQAASTSTWTSTETPLSSPTSSSPPPPPPPPPPLLSQPSSNLTSTPTSTSTRKSSRTPVETSPKTAGIADPTMLLLSTLPPMARFSTPMNRKGQPRTELPGGLHTPRSSSITTTAFPVENVPPERGERPPAVDRDQMTPSTHQTLTTPEKPSPASTTIHQFSVNTAVSPKSQITTRTEDKSAVTSTEEPAPLDRVTRLLETTLPVISHSPLVLNPSSLSVNKTELGVTITMDRDILRGTDHTSLSAGITEPSTRTPSEILLPLAKYHASPPSNDRLSTTTVTMDTHTPTVRVRSQPTTVSTSSVPVSQSAGIGQGEKIEPSPVPIRTTDFPSTLPPSVSLSGRDRDSQMYSEMLGYLSSVLPPLLASGGTEREPMINRKHNSLMPNVNVSETPAAVPDSRFLHLRTDTSSHQVGSLQNTVQVEGLQRTNHGEGPRNTSQVPNAQNRQPAGADWNSAFTSNSVDYSQQQMTSTTPTPSSSSLLPSSDGSHLPVSLQGEESSRRVQPLGTTELSTPLPPQRMVTMAASLDLVLPRAGSFLNIARSNVTPQRRPTISHRLDTMTNSGTDNLNQTFHQNSGAYPATDYGEFLNGGVQMERTDTQPAMTSDVGGSVKHSQTGNSHHQHDVGSVVSPLPMSVLPAGDSGPVYEVPRPQPLEMPSASGTSQDNPGPVYLLPTSSSQSAGLPLAPETDTFQDGVTSLRNSALTRYTFLPSRSFLDFSGGSTTAPTSMSTSGGVQESFPSSTSGYSGDASRCLALCQLFREPTLQSGNPYLDGLSRFFHSRMETTFDRLRHSGDRPRPAGDLFRLAPSGDRVTPVARRSYWLPTLLRMQRRMRQRHNR